jgi:hypothetical protein
MYLQINQEQEARMCASGQKHPLKRYRTIRSTSQLEALHRVLRSMFRGVSMSPGMFDLLWLNLIYMN